MSKRSANILLGLGFLLGSKKKSMLNPGNRNLLSLDYDSWRDIPDDFYFTSFRRNSFIPIGELFEPEIYDRENLSEADFENILKENNISRNLPVVWVVTNIKDFVPYVQDTSEWLEKEQWLDENWDMLKSDFMEGEYGYYSKSEGVLLKGTSDGDGGFVFTKHK